MSLHKNRKYVASEIARNATYASFVMKRAMTHESSYTTSQIATMTLRQRAENASYCHEKCDTRIDGVCDVHKRANHQCAGHTWEHNRK